MMTVPPPQKFMFDRAFDAAVVGRSEPARPPTYTQADLDAARRDAFQEGYAQGEQAVQQHHTAQIAAIAEQLNVTLDRLLQDATQRLQAQQQDIGAIAQAVARKVLPVYIDRHGFDEITAMLAQALQDMAHEPRLVVRIHDQMLDPLQQALPDIVAKAAYNGKVVLLADNRLAPNNCTIEWADGGIARDLNCIWQALDRAMRQNDAPAPDAPASEPEAFPTPDTPPPEE